MKTNQLKEWFAMTIVIRHRFILFAAALGLTVLGYFGMQRVVMDNSNDGLLGNEAQVIQANETFKKIFGNEEFIFIMAESEDIFTTENLNSLRNLGDDLLERLPFARSVTSIAHMEFIETEEDELIISELIPDPIPVDQAELDRLRLKLLSRENYAGRILSEDSRSAGLVIEFQTIPEEIYYSGDLKNQVVYANQVYYEPSTENLENLYADINPQGIITPALNSIMTNYDTPDFQLHATGVPVVNYYMDEIGNRENIQAFLISLIIALLLLILIFRDFLSVVAPVLVMISAAILTYGITGWLGIPISMGSVIIACLLLILSVSYSIHVINHFRRGYEQTGSAAAGVVASIKHSIWPCFITAMTTVIGFLSFLFVPLVPMQNLGIICAIGVTITYMLVITLVPAMLSLKRDKVNPLVAKKNRGPDMDGFLSYMASLSQRSLFPTVLFVLGIGALSLLLSPSILVDTDFVNMYGESNFFVRETSYITDRLGALYSYEVLIELPESGQAKSTKVLQALDAMEQEIQSFDATKRLSSINNLVKEIAMIMNQNQQEYYAIPQNQRLLSQYLLLYEISGGEELNQWMDYDERFLRISVQAKRFTTTTREDFDRIEAMGAELLPPGTKLSITGDMAIMMESMGALVDGQIASVAAALIGISLILILILRSIRVGLLSMIPNILPLLVVAVIMAFFKISLNMQTIMVAPLLIGIAVDDTVHYFLSYRREFRTDPNYVRANKHTFLKVGGAIIFTSVILSLGFLSFAFSSIKSIVQVAILLSSGIAAALLADLWITPGLFIWLKPFGKEKPIPQGSTYVVQEEEMEEQTRESLEIS